ncbi:MAG TPA: SRPBCC domain-containing protein [Terriglobales bacterium]|nr:SRPBCC domain-containing protein [Terriglobales bacterium]
MMATNKPQVEVRRRFAAPPEKVFAAFADARLITRWLSPSPKIALTPLRFEFREGGTYRFAYGLEDGKTVIVNGTYILIDPPSKIVFSWIIEPPDEHAGIESEVTVAIKPDDGGTELLIQHKKLILTDAIVRHAAGWHGALDQLAAALETEKQHDR